MNESTTLAIRKEFRKAAPGTLIPTSQLLRHGTRVAVDQALSRLERSGEIARATRGLYYRPKMSRLVGAVPPEPQAVAEALAASRGEVIARHGAEAARLFGLSTQAQLSPVFLTSGPSRTVPVGKTTMQLRHASPKAMALAGRPAGEALRALRNLGSSQVTPEVIAKVQEALPASEFSTLREATAVMPAWLSDAFFAFESHEGSNSPERAGSLVG
jgi:hypothetical protein